MGSSLTRTNSPKIFIAEDALNHPNQVLCDAATLRENLDQPKALTPQELSALCPSLQHLTGFNVGFFAASRDRLIIYHSAVESSSLRGESSGP
jgi:hypothetical protein